MNPFDQHLERVTANHVPLSPLSFLPRTAAIYPDGAAVVHGDRSYSWAEAYRRCRRLASALASLGVGKGDVVAVMAPNTPPMWEAHHGVPMLGRFSMRLTCGWTPRQLPSSWNMATPRC